jgi:hypothetical protein
MMDSAGVANTPQFVYDLAKLQGGENRIGKKKSYTERVRRIHINSVSKTKQEKDIQINSVSKTKQQNDILLPTALP